MNLADRNNQTPKTRGHHYSLDTNKHQQQIDINSNRNEKVKEMSISNEREKRKLRGVQDRATSSNKRREYDKTLMKLEDRCMEESVDSADVGHSWKTERGCAHSRASIPWMKWLQQPTVRDQLNVYPGRESEAIYSNIDLLKIENMGSKSNSWSKSNIL
jgi:hypothetical protein